MASKRPEYNKPIHSKGDTVRVTVSGPFCGRRGEVVKVKGTFLVSYEVEFENGTKKTFTSNQVASA